MVTSSLGPEHGGSYKTGSALTSMDGAPPGDSASPDLVSPKQPPSPHRRDWYPYYAGYTEEFVHGVLKAHVGEAALVLDPWSGSGTTTAVCLNRGLTSRGLDINPALTVIARARLTPVSLRQDLAASAARIVDAAPGLDPQSHPVDLLQRWLRPASVRTLRAIQAAIHFETSTSTSVPAGPKITASTDVFTTVLAFFYCALFHTVRDLLAPFRTSNPMWFRPPASYRHRKAPSPDTIVRFFLESVQALGGRLSLSSPLMCNPEELPFSTGTATALPFRDSTVDAVVTSPPYATRLDYVLGTLPELAVLGADDVFLDALRKQSTGSPVVRGASHSDPTDLLSERGRETLAHIDAHPSKGSRSYYYPWMSNYLTQLQLSLLEIHRTVTPSGVICIVVQDSYYKTFLVNLQQIVVETLQACGRRLRQRYDYPAPNPRTDRHCAIDTSPPPRFNTETLLVFGDGDTVRGSQL